MYIKKLAIFFITVLIAMPVQAEIYLEDFATIEYCDTNSTTAWWDTDAGELKLYPLVLEEVGHCDTPGAAYEIALAGNYAYVADGEGGMQVIDISDPTSPNIVGNWAIEGVSRTVGVYGDYAFLGGDHPFYSIDISDPTQPDWGDITGTPGTPYDIVVDGLHLYIACMYGGLDILNIESPDDMFHDSYYSDIGQARGVDFDGDHIYVTDQSYGLIVMDISDHWVPLEVGSLDLPEDSKGVTIAGDYAYVSNYSAGLQVVDISDPTNPNLVGSHPSSGLSFAAAVAGDHLYLANYQGGLQVFDISNPPEPVLVGGIDTPDRAFDVVVAGNYAYVADGSSGFRVIKIAHRIPSSAAVAECPLNGYAEDIEIEGNYAYVVNGLTGNYGLQVVDISDPLDPVLVGIAATSLARTWGIDIAGDYAYIANDGNGLTVIDISDPENPQNAGWVDTPGYAYDVVASDDYACIAVGYEGLCRIDISDPENPVYVSNVETLDDAYGLARHGDRLYVACDEAGLQVHTFPGMWHRGGVDTPGEARDVDVEGDYAFLTDRYYGLQIIDISDPSNPFIAGNAAEVYFATAVDVEGDLAFVAAGGYDEMYIYDVSDPPNPVLLGVSQTTDSALGVAIDGNYAFLSCYTSGLQVIPVFYRDLVTPLNMGWSLPVIETLGMISSVKMRTVQDATVHWEISADDGAHWQGILPDESWQVVDTPGHSLLWRSRHDYTEPGVNPAVSELEIDCEIDMTSVEDETAPALTQLLPAHPNPFNPRVRIPYKSAMDQVLKIEIIDASGRRLKVLQEGFVSAGSGEVIWNGTDEKGRPVSSGVYLARMTAGDLDQSQRLVLLR